MSGSKRKAKLLHASKDEGRRELLASSQWLSIAALSSTLGVSESYAADIRAGRHRPHPRHWVAMARLVISPSEGDAKINGD
jgi:hypothetical protein